MMQGVAVTVPSGIVPPLSVFVGVVSAVEPVKTANSVSFVVCCPNPLTVWMNAMPVSITSVDQPPRSFSSTSAPVPSSSTRTYWFVATKT
jgi:hypothetical protein